MSSLKKAAEQNLDKDISLSDKEKPMLVVPTFNWSKVGQTIVIGGNTGINSIENEAEDKYIQIYDLNGNPAFVGSKSQLSDLKKGIYIQKEIEINGKVKTYKILVR